MSARLLAILPRDRRVVVLPIDQARSDVVVAIAPDRVLGARAAQAPHHGILFRLGRLLKFLSLGLAVGQGFDGTAATDLSNLRIRNLLLSRPGWLSPVYLRTARKLVLCCVGAFGRSCKCVGVALIGEHLNA